MKHYIFSYGTLACKEVAEMTGKTLDFIPAYLKGYERNFHVPVKEYGLAAAGIEKKEGAITLGMLVQVPEEELLKFDEREKFYDRIEIDFKLLASVDNSLIPKGKYYLYLPNNPEEPTNKTPLVQSYIDVILTPFLELDQDLAAHLVESMKDLDHPWINDREMPRYPRALSNPDVETIDNFLSEVAPEFFKKRKEISKAIKPELIDSILKTIGFFDLFDFPMTVKEIMTNLYKYHHPLHIKELKMTLQHLIGLGKLVEIKSYFVLPGKESILETRKTRKFISEKLWNRTNLYGTYMRSVPFVRMIAVCNNLAYNNASQESDIDLFIVVKPGRMWLARFFITVILHFFGVRRHGNKVAGRFCLSFFVTTNKMSMKDFSLKNEDPYLAYWVKNLKPIFGQQTYQEFCDANRRWLIDYGLNFDESYKKHMYHHKDSLPKRFFEWLFGGFFGNILEKLLRAVFKRRSLQKMKKLDSKANVIVTDDILKFHNHDRRQEFFDRWVELL